MSDVFKYHYLKFQCCIKDSRDCVLTSDLSHSQIIRWIDFTILPPVHLENWFIWVFIWRFQLRYIKGKTCTSCHRLTLNDVVIAGRREMGGYLLELTGEEVFWQALGSDASSGALDYHKVISIILIGGHKLCLFTRGLLHACVGKKTNCSMNIKWREADTTAVHENVQYHLNFIFHICQTYNALKGRLVWQKRSFMPGSAVYAQ